MRVSQCCGAPSQGGEAGPSSGSAHSSTTSDDVSDRVERDCPLESVVVDQDDVVLPHNSYVTDNGLLNQAIAELDALVRRLSLDETHLERAWPVFCRMSAALSLLDNP